MVNRHWTHHILLILKPLSDPNYDNNQLSLMRFTAQWIKFYQRVNEFAESNKLKVNMRDRKYPIWQRNPRATEFYSGQFIEQKSDDIHQNPVSCKCKLAKTGMGYHNSTIRFYAKNDITLYFLPHYMKDI